MEENTGSTEVGTKTGSWSGKLLTRMGKNTGWKDGGTITEEVFERKKKEMGFGD